MRAFLVVLVCCVAVLSACSPSGEGQADARQSPEEVAQAFMEAGSAGDKEAFEVLLTAKARESLEGDDGFQMSGQDFDSFAVGESTVTGTAAEVKVQAVQAGQEQNMTLKMRDEAGAWRVYAAAVSFGEGMEISIDFEKIGAMMESMVESIGEGLQQSFEEAFANAAEEELARKKALYDGLTAGSREDYEGRWKNTTDFQGRPALDALRGLAGELDLVLIPGEHEAALSGTVGESLVGLSRLEAIERVCKEAGLYPVYPDPDGSLTGLGGAMVEALVAGLEEMLVGDDTAIAIEGTPPQAATEPEAKLPANAMVLMKGPRPYPVSFSGPFIVEVTGVEENAPNPTGNLKLAIRSYGLSESTLGLLSEEYSATVFTTIVDARDRDLNDPNVTYMSNGQANGSRYFDGFGIGLKNLIREVETIHRVAGTQSITVPLAVEEVTFETLEPGVVKTLGDLSIELKEAGTQTRFDITGPEAVLQVLQVRFWALATDGETESITYESADRWQAGKVQAYFNTQEPPARVSMKLVTRSMTETHPFELREIPLTRYSEMPEKLVELAFAGHDVPMSITLVEIKERSDFSKVDMKVENHSNKDALSVFATFHYLDAKGVELEDFPHTIQGSFTMDGPQLLAAGGATEQIETTAFQMPAGAQTIRVEIHKLEFTDGTAWEKQGPA